MHILKDKNTEDLLSSDNLLYVDQKVAEDTEITFEFNLEDPNQEYDVIFVGNKLEHTHSYELISESAATCNTPGLTVSHCSCGDEKQTELSALGHHYDLVITPATCVSNGYTTNTCISCGDSYTSDMIDRLPHNLSNWYTVTCEVDGIEERKCWDCDYSETQIISANGHDFDGSACKNCGFDKADSCSCKCHKSGIAKIIFKIILIFQKIFKKNKECTCGAYHY